MISVKVFLCPNSSNSPSWSRKNLPGSHRYRTVPVASPLTCQVPARRSSACTAVSGCRGAVVMSAISFIRPSTVNGPGHSWLGASRPALACRVLPPAGPEPAPPAWWLLPFRGGAHVHVAEQPVGPYPDKRGARPPGDRREPQLAVAQHVDPGHFDLQALRHIHSQVAEQRDGGDVDHIAIDNRVPQVEMEITEQRAGAEHARQPPAACLPPVTEERDDRRDRARRSDRRRGPQPGRSGVELVPGFRGQRRTHPPAELLQRQPPIS